MQLAIPHPDKQREIVKEYNTILDRINLNNQLIQKLEETVQAIYNQWFVDFEFPDAEGKAYKSNGGEMEWNEELEMEVPKGWECVRLEAIIERFISNRGKSKSLMKREEKNSIHVHPVITAMNIKGGRLVKHDTITYADAETFREWMHGGLLYGDVLMTSEAPLGELLYITKRTDFILSQRLYGLRVKKDICSGVYLFHWLKSHIAKKDLEGRATGTTVLGIKETELRKVSVLLPHLQYVSAFERTVRILMETLEDKAKEKELLSELRNLLLSKLATIEN